MVAKLVLLVGVCIVQGSWSLPSPQTSVSADVSTGTAGTAGTTVSAGTSLSTDFNNNLAAVLKNAQNGMTSLTTPLVKTTFTTIPGIFSKFLKAGTSTAGKIAETKVNNSMKIVNGASKAIGGGAVLGSSLLGSAMKLAGSGVDMAGKLLDNGTSGLLTVGGQVVDSGLQGVDTLGSLGQGALNLAGDGMTAAGGGVTVVADGLTKTVDTLGTRIGDTMNSVAEKMAEIIKTQASTANTNVNTAASTVETRAYSLMKDYLLGLSTMQNMFETILSGLATASTATTTPSVSATATVAA